MTKRICVIGGGPGGYVAAIRSAQLGENVTLVEKNDLGGTCLNWGCIPSKIMKASSELFEKINYFDDFGIDLKSKPHINMEKLQLKKKKIIDIQKNGIKSLLEHNGVQIKNGSASFASESSINIEHNGEKETLSFDKFIIAAGTKIRGLKGFEFDHTDILSSDDLLSLDYLPESIAIIGGGIIGCEFASILNGLGCEVTLVETENRLLPLKSLEPDISKALEREFKKKKIKVFTGSFAKIKERSVSGFIIDVIPENPKKKGKEISCSKIAVCTGRIPVTDSLNSDLANIEIDDQGWVKVDSDYQTSNKDIYAIGDILGPEFSMLAHTASFEGRVCAEKISGNDFTSFNYSRIPGAIFTSPEIGSIGLTLESAAEKGFDAIKEKVLFRTSGKAHAIGEIAGEAIVIADKNSGIILGIHIIGPHASDLLGEASLAVQEETSFFNLANYVHAHPTLSEIIMEASLKLAGIGIHG